jgi:hypothetical protein
VIGRRVLPRRLKQHSNSKDNPRGSTASFYTPRHEFAFRGLTDVDVRADQSVRPVRELAEITVPIVGAVLWAITKLRLRKFEFMNVAADSTEEPRCPFRRDKSQVLTIGAKTALKRSSRLHA